MQVSHYMLLVSHLGETSIGNLTLDTPWLPLMENNLGKILLQRLISRLSLVMLVPMIMVVTAITRMNLVV